MPFWLALSGYGLSGEFCSIGLLVDSSSREFSIKDAAAIVVHSFRGVVISGLTDKSAPCPLYPQQRKLGGAAKFAFGCRFMSTRPSQMAVARCRSQTHGSA